MQREKNVNYLAGWGVTFTTSTQTASVLKAFPVVIEQKCEIDQLAVLVTTLAASSTVRLGIYRDDRGIPGALVVDAGTIASTSTGWKNISSVVSGILEPGTYWIAAVRQGSGIPTLQTVATTCIQFMSRQVTSAASPTHYMEVSGVSGALPDPFGTVATVSNGINTDGPSIWYRIKNSQIINLLTAEENDQAGSFTVVQTPVVPGTVVQARETDQAGSFTPRMGQRISFGPVVETDSARPISPVSPTRSLVTSGSGSDVASYPTTAYTPVGNRLVLGFVFSRPNNLSLTPATPTMTGNGYTWVQVATVLDGTGDYRATLFRAMVASPTEGAATIDFGGQNQELAMWSIVEFRGVDTSGTNGSGAVVQAVTGTDGPAANLLPITLASLASAANYTYGGYGLFGLRGVATVNTLIAKLGVTNAGTVVTEYGVNTTQSGVLISSGASTVINGIAVEIKTT